MNLINSLLKIFKTRKESDNRNISDINVELSNFKQEAAGNNVEPKNEEVSNNAGTKLIEFADNIEVALIGDEQWSCYEKSYQQMLVTAAKIAYHSVNEYIIKEGISPSIGWIDTMYCPQSFHHLCLRADSNVYSIIIALQGVSSSDGSVDDRYIIPEYMYRRLMNETDKNNLIPCIVPVALSLNKPLVGKSHILNLITKGIVNLQEVSGCSVPMSTWEVHNMGISVICNYLENEGYNVCSACDVLQVSPQIWFGKNGKWSFVIVRSVAYDDNKTKYNINKSILSKLSDYNGYFVNVNFFPLFPHPESFIRTDDGSVKFLDNRKEIDGYVLMRSEPYVPKFNGLQELREALEDYSFLELIDDVSYRVF